MGGSRTKRTAIAALTLAGTVLGPPAPSARAQFPGANGPIVFTSERDGNREIYRKHVDGVTDIRLTNNSVEDSDPQVSADGGGILFVSARDGNPEVFRMNLVGGNVVQLTQTGGGISNLQPSWSPDGTRVTFSSNRIGGDYEIYTAGISAAETDVVQLTNNSINDTGPSWSPDGTRIVFNSNVGGSWDLYEVDPLNTSTVRQLTFHAGIDFGADYLPDGSGILFASNRTGTFQILQSVLSQNMADADAAATNVSNRPGLDNSEPEPTPDGTGVVWEGRSSPGGPFQLFRRLFGGGAVEQVTTGPARNGDPAMGARVPACRDGDDNDEDDRTDFSDDPGCDSPDDETESPEPPCADDVDNDGDGLFDFGGHALADPSCDSLRDGEGTVRTVTTIFKSFRHGSPFRGRIDASSRRCLEDRSIQVRRLQAGDDPLVAAASTDGEGAFIARHASGMHRRAHTFQARAVPFGYFSPDFEVFVRCLGARSQRLFVPAAG